MAKISFENIAGDGQDMEVPDGFRNLKWNSFFAVDDEQLEEVIGNSDAIRTGEAAAFNDNRGIAKFQSFKRADDFDLDSGYFTAFNANNLKVTVSGFDDGERVARKSFTLDTDREFVRFGREFDDIDEVWFGVGAGRDANPNDDLPPFLIFGVDDLLVV